MKKLELEEALRRERESVKALRYEIDFVTAERRSAEARARGVEKRADVLERRLRDLRGSLDGVEDTRSRIRELLGVLDDAKTELTGQVMLLELPPGQSGHQSMNDFICGTVRGDRSTRG